MLGYSKGNSTRTCAGIISDIYVPEKTEGKVDITMLEKI